MHGRALSVFILLSSGACGPTGYACLDSEQCVSGELRGVCQPTGSCSFPDGACDSGQRYGSLSDRNLAEQCVPLEGETGSGSTTIDTHSGGVSGGREEEASTSEAGTSGPPNPTSSSAGRRNPSESEGTGGPPDPPDPACTAYCDVKEGCGYSTPACIDACQSGIDHAFSLGSTCGEALETLRDCRTYQSCEDLADSFYQPISSDCGIAYEAVGQACTQSICVGLCSAIQDCGGGPLPPPPGVDRQKLPCGVECSARALDVHLEGGLVPCGQAFGTLLECVSMLSCEALLYTVEFGHYGACPSESSVVQKACPDPFDD